MVPYFFRENMNGDSYLNLLKNELGGRWDNMALQERKNLWFQHDECWNHIPIPREEFLND